MRSNLGMTRKRLTANPNRHLPARQYVGHITTNLRVASIAPLMNTSRRTQNPELKMRRTNALKEKEEEKIYAELLCAFLRVLTDA